MHLCVSVNKISQEVFDHTTAVLVEIDFPLTLEDEVMGKIALGKGGCGGSKILA